MRNVLVTLSVVLLLADRPAAGQCAATFVAGPGPGSALGSAVATSGALMMASSTANDTVHPYILSGGQWVADGPPIVGASGSRFGASLTMNSNVAVIGAPDATVGGVPAGEIQAWIRDLSGWSLLDTTAVPPSFSRSASDDFGFSVDHNDGFVVVGDPSHSSGAGRAFLFALSPTSGFTFIKALNPVSTGSSTTPRYGFSVSVSSDYTVVGAPYADFGGTDTGVVVVHLTSSPSATSLRYFWDSKPLGELGHAVFVRGTTVGMGQPGVNSDAGVFSVWKGSGGSSFQEIEEVFWNEPGARFGEAVDMLGTTVFASVPRYEDLTGVERHAVWKARISGQTLIQKTTFFPQQATSDLFSGAMAVTFGDLLLGAPGDDTGGVGAGGMYDFNLFEQGWSWTEDDATGQLDAIGEGPLCADTSMHVGVKSTLLQRPAFLVAGISRVDLPFLGGILGPAPDIFLGGLTTDSAGVISLPASLPAGTPGGLTFHFQFWINDATNGWLGSETVTGTTW